MKLVRFIVRGLITWSLLLFLLGIAFAASSHAAEDLLGLFGFALLAGAVLSLLVRRPDTTPRREPDPQLPFDPAPVLMPPAAHEIPGSRGARVALDHQPAGRAPSDALAVSFRGEIKAYVTCDGWQPVGAFAELDSDDPEYRLVAWMSVYSQHVLLASQGVYTEQDAIVYALAELVPHELLERDLPDPAQTAAALRLPPDALTRENLHALRVAITERNAHHAAAHDPQSPE